jgi:endonuclease/exonuclease/phosphatase family metal-dependent hydrolase
LTRLRLVTYNVHKCVGTDRALDVGRVADVLRHYEPDVVCLQEVLWSPGANGAQAQPRLIADALGMRHGAVGLNCRRRAGVYGNVTLSRLPVELSTNLDLTVRFKKPRGALYTRVQVGGARVHVFNVHLGLLRFERAIQMQNLVDQVPELAGQDEPVVVLGDTNDWRNRLGVGVCTGAGLRCVTGSDTEPGHATFPSWYPVGALDKVFCNDRLRLLRAYPSRLALARLASDHLPMVVDFEVPGP